MSQRAEGFVLAGGRSRRMGRDKALVELLGQPLIALAALVLRGAGLAVRIAGARQPLALLAAHAAGIEDKEKGHGPLSGICAALEATEMERAVFLPVDMPLMAPRVIEKLVEAAEAGDALVALTTLEGRPQSFPAVVHREALQKLREEMEAGRRGVLAGFQAAAEALGRPVLLVEAESVASAESVVQHLYLNINTEEDLRGVDALLHRGWR